MTIPFPARHGLLLAVLVIVVDQATKLWIVDGVMVPPRAIEVTSFFNIVMVWNRGISFGLFNNGSPLNALILPALALAIVAVLLFWLWRADGRLTPIALGSIIGGALGNVIDRLRYDGAVADFLDFHVAGHHWPAFNVADAAIVVGVALLALDLLVLTRGEETAKEPGSPRTGTG